MFALLSADSQRIATILTNAPAWAKLGLMDRDARIRETAAETLAVNVADKLLRSKPEIDERQMLLAIA